MGNFPKFSLWPGNEVHLFGRSIRQIPESPETVLDQSLAGVCQVEAQSLHASWTKSESLTDLL